MRKSWVVLVLFFAVFSIYLVGSVSRNISDTQDNKETLIRNSNGNYWEANNANIQAAINDLGSGGTVWLPRGTFVITQSIQLNSNMKLVGAGSSTILKLGNSQNKDILVINGQDNCHQGHWHSTNYQWSSYR